MRTRALRTLETPLIARWLCTRQGCLFGGYRSSTPRHVAKTKQWASARWRAACLWRPCAGHQAAIVRISKIGGAKAEAGGFNFGGFSGMHLGIGGTLVLIVFSV